MSSPMYQAVFAKSPCAMLIADNEGRYVDVNPAGEALLGCPREQIIGKRVVDFASPLREEATEDLWKQFQMNGKQTGHFVIARPDGTDRLVRYSAVTDVLPGLHLSILYEMTAHSP